MSHSPDFETFARLAGEVDLVPVFRRLTSDSLTPVSAFSRIDTGESGCLFESVIGGEKVGRYSFLAARPSCLLEARGDQLTIVDDSGRRETTCADPLEELRRRVTATRAARLPELPPFVSGAVGYAGYDVVRYTEHLPNAPADDRKLPDLSFAFYENMVVFDNVNKKMFVVVMARCNGRGSELRDSYEAACGEVDRLVEELSAPSDRLLPMDIDTAGPWKSSYNSNFQRAEFEEAVRRCVDYIRAGDIFQVVISQRLAMPLRSRPFEVYRTLRIVNPSPFMFYLRTPSVTLVGSSPEIMARIVDRRLTVRPLAGTRPRGHVLHAHDELAAEFTERLGCDLRTMPSDKIDDLLAEELLADPKERAEHVMLVDLGRNDVGRVARFDTVELSDVMTIERYSHVMHITSNVEGELREGCDAFDALRACLPAGTVSGAPKVRAMEIIDELEPHRRGPYAGAVGYVDFSGNMDTCIALRTIVVQDGTAYVQAGAGIVADSIPSAEYQETLNKARGLLNAIEITERRAGDVGA